MPNERVLLPVGQRARARSGNLRSKPDGSRVGGALVAQLSERERTWHGERATYRNAFAQFPAASPDRPNQRSSSWLIGSALFKLLQ